MSKIESPTVGDVPVLLRPPEREDESAPLIVLWHGFGRPESEQALAKALPLDEVHAFKAYLGLPLFGERLPEGGAEELMRRQKENYLMELYRPMAEGAVAELSEVVEVLSSRFEMLQVDGGIGLFGFSAGAGAALLALVESEVPISAAMVSGASKNAEAAVAAAQRFGVSDPQRWDEQERRFARRADPIARAEDLVQRDPVPALLILHGTEDEACPLEKARELYESLQPHYERAGHPERLSVEILDGFGHNFGAEPDVSGPVPIHDAAPVRQAASRWFGKHLGD